jgi:FkbM family methyltransferase
VLLINTILCYLKKTTVVIVGVIYVSKTTGKKTSKIAKYYNRIKRTYRFIKDNKVLADPVDTPLGFKLIGHGEMEKGVFEPEETALVKRILKNVDIFINIGANIGYYCCIALKENKYTVAFEPVDSNLRCLYRNLKANEFKDIFEVFPVALSNKPGLIEMFGSGTGASLIKGWADTPEYHVSLVPVSTLDTVLGSRFNGARCFILVDVEGAERLMLEGASSFLSADPKPIWMVEISTTEHQPKGIAVNPDFEATFQKFWNNGYEAWTASEEMRLVTKDEVEKICRGGRNTFSTNNFIFMESGIKDNLFR